MTTFDGFDIEPHATNTFLFRRVCEPRHEYVVRVTSQRIELAEVWPFDIECGDPGVDAIRFKDDLLKAAKKYQCQLFAKTQSV